MSTNDISEVHYYRDGSASVECSCGFESAVLKTPQLVSMVSISHGRKCRRLPAVAAQKAMAAT